VTPRGTIHHVRYGIELEGPYQGLTTLVLLSARQHSLALVRRLLAEHEKEAKHVWVECEHFERYDWLAVWEIASAGYKVTALVRNDHDLPPESPAAPSGVSLIWRVPSIYRRTVSACSGINVPGLLPFTGVESRLQFRVLDTAAYKEDEVWPCT
jgi:hypothetical protein